jgi:hypothetical protein
MERSINDIKVELLKLETETRNYGFKRALIGLVPIVANGCSAYLIRYYSGNASTGFNDADRALLLEIKSVLHSVRNAARHDPVFSQGNADLISDALARLNS